jgi:hypothetical protein
MSSPASVTQPVEILCNLAESFFKGFILKTWRHYSLAMCQGQAVPQSWMRWKPGIWRAEALAFKIIRLFEKQSVEFLSTTILNFK